MRPLGNELATRCKHILRIALLRLAFFSIGAALGLALSVAWAAPGRHALVVGINSYQSPLPALDNAVGDARAMAGELTRAGYEVKTVLNAERLVLLQAVTELARRAEGGGDAVFFFAGHGIQVGNTNFLIPQDFKTPDPALLEHTAVSLPVLTNILLEAKARFALMIIDACRDNPLPATEATRSIRISKGLAPATPATGQMIVFSAGSGQTALDRLDARDRTGNSLFVREFIKAIRAPGLSMRDAIDLVRDSVEQLASSVGHAQRPALYDESRGKFYFYPPGPGAAASTTARPKTSEEIEDDLWRLIGASQDAADFEAYLKEYPSGRYAAAARVRLARLARISDSAPAPPQSRPDTGAVIRPATPQDRAPTPAPRTVPTQPLPANPYDAASGSGYGGNLGRW